MQNRSFALAALAPLVMLAACNSDMTFAPSTNPNALIRFINASAALIDVSNASPGDTANSNLGYGGSSTCLIVSPSTPQLAFRQSGTTTPIAFTPRFAAGRQYEVVASTTASGATRLDTLDITYRVPVGQAAVRVFNAAPGSGSLVPMLNHVPLGSGTAVSYGAAGGFTPVPAGAQNVSFNTGTATVLDAGNITFFTDVRTTVIVAPAATGTGLRAFGVTSC